MKTWVKLYTEFNHDPDIGILTWGQRGILSSLFALAGEIDDRDENDRETGVLDTVARTAWRVRCAEQEIRDLMQAWGNGEKLIEDDAGILVIVNYGERQQRRPSDAHEQVAERVRKSRAAKRGNGNADVTQVNRGESPSESESESESETPGADAPKPRKRNPQDGVRLAMEVRFSELTGIPRPQAESDKEKRNAGTLWWAPLRSIAELVSWDQTAALRLVDLAVSQLKGNCTVSSPKSIANTALAIHTGNAPGVRSNSTARASPNKPGGNVVVIESTGAQI